MQIDFASSGGANNIQLAYQGDTETLPDVKKRLEEMMER